MKLCKSSIYPILHCPVLITTEDFSSAFSSTSFRSKERHKSLGKDLCDCSSVGGLNGLEVLPSKMSVSAEGRSNAFAKTYGSPPWSSSPPQGTDPDTASLLHEHRAPWTAWMQTVLLPAPISPRNPRMLLACSHEVASANREDPMLELTQVAEVPEPSESRYWCISVDTHL